MFWLSTILLSLFWGGSYLAIRFVVEEVPPFSGAAVRIVLCTTLTFILLKIRRPPSTPIKWRIASVIVGIFMMGIPWALLFWAEKTVLPSLAALTGSSIPIFTLLFAPWITPAERHPRRLWIGVGTGFVGVFLLVLPSWRSPDPSEVWGGLALIVMAICYAIGTLGVRRLSPHLPIAVNLFYQTLGGLAVLIPLILIKEEFLPWTWSHRTWLAIVYLAVCSTFIAWLLYFWIVRRFGTILASVVAYFPPLVSLLLDRLILNTVPPFLSVLGGMIILIGVYLTQKIQIPRRALKNLP